MGKEKPAGLRSIRLFESSRLLGFRENGKKLVGQLLAECIY